MINTLFSEKLAVVNLGAEIFKNDLAAQGVPAVHVDWKPPAGGDVSLMNALDSLKPLEGKIQTANQEAYDRFTNARPVLVDIQTALDFIPGMTPKTILHSGPPMTWESMSGPMRGAVMGALIYEGLAADALTAERLAASGEIAFSPCHEKGGVGPMAGVVSASMPLFILKKQDTWQHGLLHSKRRLR